jgi:hypothetical protein
VLNADNELIEFRLRRATATYIAANGARVSFQRDDAQAADPPADPPR